jgi:hypothetical protein
VYNIVAFSKNNCIVNNMQKVFRTNVYTSEALAAELEAITSYDPQVYIAGSLGRAVIFAKHGLSPVVEYEVRGQHPLGHGSKPRDIDVIGIDPAVDVDFEPFAVDRTAFAKDVAAIVREGDSWFLVSKVANYSEQLHPDIMEPVEGNTIFDIPCRTLPLDTHRNLFDLAGHTRAKDHVARKLLTSVESTDRLPAELFKPFEELRSINTRLFTHLQRAYWCLVPENIRLGLRPITTRIKSSLGR